MIVALDLSFSSTGWCIGDAEGDPVFGSLSFSDKAEENRRYAVYLKWLSARLKEHQPEIVGYEAAFQGKNPKTTAVLFGLAAITEAVAEIRGAKTVPVSIGDWRKNIWGRGAVNGYYDPVRGKQISRRDALKEASVRFSQGLGWNVANDDEADACGVWLYTHLHRGNQRGARRILERSKKVF